MKIVTPILDKNPGQPSPGRSPPPIEMFRCKRVPRGRWCIKLCVLSSNIFFGSKKFDLVDVGVYSFRFGKQYIYVDTICAYYSFKGFHSVYTGQIQAHLYTRIYNHKLHVHTHTHSYTTQHTEEIHTLSATHTHAQTYTHTHSHTHTPLC